MLNELDTYLSLTKQQKQAYSLLRRGSYGQYPLSVVQDESVMQKILPEIKRLEACGEDGFDKYIETLMSYQLPQPQTEDWN